MAKTVAVEKQSHKFIYEVSIEVEFNGESAPRVITEKVLSDKQLAESEVVEEVERIIRDTYMDPSEGSDNQIHWIVPDSGYVKTIFVRKAQ